MYVASGGGIKVINCPEGVYAWVVAYSFKHPEQDVIQTSKAGTLTLYR